MNEESALQIAASIKGKEVATTTSSSYNYSKGKGVATTTSSSSSSSSYSKATAPVYINRGNSSCSYYAQPSYKQQLSRWPYDLFPGNAQSSHDHHQINNEITEAARSESECSDEFRLPYFIYKAKYFAPSRITEPVQYLYAAFSCSVGVLFAGYLVRNPARL
jgi:hypothetical protein